VVDLVLKLRRRYFVWSLLTGGRYSVVVVNTGLTVLQNFTLLPCDIFVAEKVASVAILERYCK